MVYTGEVQAQTQSLNFLAKLTTHTHTHTRWAENYRGKLKLEGMRGTGSLRHVKAFQKYTK